MTGMTNSLLGRPLVSQSPGPKVNMDEDELTQSEWKIRSVGQGTGRIQQPWIGRCQADDTHRH
jgi:hypothetical protein